LCFGKKKPQTVDETLGCQKKKLKREVAEDKKRGGGCPWIAPMKKANPWEIAITQKEATDGGAATRSRKKKT